MTYPDALLDWAHRTAAGETLGLDGGLSALQALERKLARACDLPRLDVALPPRAAARDRDRAADLAAFYGLAAEPYGAGMDGAGPYYLRCRRSTNSANGCWQLWHLISSSFICRAFSANGMSLTRVAARCHPFAEDELGCSGGWVNT